MMKNFKYDRDYLLENTNGGLEVILSLYPEAQTAGGKFQNFILSFYPEKNPSASIAPISKTGGIAIVKNFATGETYNCFDLLIKEGLVKDFGEACKWIAQKFSLAGEKVSFSQAKLEFRPAEKGQNHNDYIFSYKEKPSNADLDVLGPLVTQKILEEDFYPVQIFALNSFTQIKTYEKNHPNKDRAGRTFQIITHSADNYPIFLIEAPGFQKIYQPLNQDKAFRFRYVPGQKPKNWLVGIEKCQELYQERFNELLSNSEDEEPNKKEIARKAKLDYIIIAAGDRDAINITSLGYPTVWKNSETEKITWKHYKELKRIAKNICVVPDLDETGIREGIELIETYIDIKLVWLPDWVKERTYRGSPGKDATDYVKGFFRAQMDKKEKEKATKKITSNFRRLLETALPYKFWEEVYDKKGNFRKYNFNSEAAYRFLNYNGYYRLKEYYRKEDYTFIRIQENIVDRVDIDEVKNYPAKYLRDSLQPIKLLNFIHDTSKLNDRSLGKIAMANPDFTKAGEDFQRWFFQNSVWTITKHGIEQQQYRQLKNHVWRDDIIPKSVRPNSERNFNISKLADGSWDIEILNKNNHILNYCINTSRVHWRKSLDDPYHKLINEIVFENQAEFDLKKEEILKEREAYREENKFNIAEKRLSALEIQQQKAHLVNKIYAIGYLLHTYKRRDRAWCVFAMDESISDVTDSNGGSGKSFLFTQAIPNILKQWEEINAGDPDVYNDRYVLGNVTPQTDMVVFDDMDSRFPMRKVFSNVTGDFSVRKMHMEPINLPYQSSPKIVFTSNFGLWDNSGSVLRRMLFVAYSDYYHYKLDGDFEEYTPRDDFGMELIKDFTDEEYNDFVNFMAECLQFYLSVDEKINPPMEKIEMRNDLQRMGDDFKSWADGYFIDERLNTIISKDEAHEDYIKQSGRKISSRIFKENLIKWTRFSRYDFNPKNKGIKYDANGRIMQRNIEGKVCEHFYIDNTYISDLQDKEINQTNRQKDLRDQSLLEDDDGIPY